MKDYLKFLIAFFTTLVGGYAVYIGFAQAVTTYAQGDSAIRFGFSHSLRVELVQELEWTIVALLGLLGLLYGFFYSQGMLNSPKRKK